MYWYVIPQLFVAPSSGKSYPLFREPSIARERQQGQHGKAVSTLANFESGLYFHRSMSTVPTAAVPFGVIAPGRPVISEFRCSLGSTVPVKEPVCTYSSYQLSIERYLVAGHQYACFPPLLPPSFVTCLTLAWRVIDSSKCVTEIVNPKDVRKRSKMFRLSRLFSMQMLKYSPVTLQLKCVHCVATPSAS